MIYPIGIFESLTPCK